MENEELYAFLIKRIKEYRSRVTESTDTLEILCLNDAIEDMKFIVYNFL